MSLEIIGRIIQKLPLQSGQSAKGAWSKQEFIFETIENFPRKVCMSVWGADKVAELSSFSEGETVKVSFNLESRSYNERWYTDVRAWRIERAGAPEGAAGSSGVAGVPSGGFHGTHGATAFPESAPFHSEPSFLDSASDSGGVDDLPF